MKSQLLALAGVVKSTPKLNNLLRYNPFYYSPIAIVIRTIEQTSASNRRAAVQPLLQKTLRAAAKTRYGRGRSLRLAEWPVLTKEVVRQNPAHFHTGQWVSVPASTSGSSGVPLRLKRSLENIAAEQAFLDTLIPSPTPKFRDARVAVLRGDTVKNPADYSPPFGLYRHPHRLVLSFSHLNNATANWYIDELTKFRPDIFWVYPTGADFLASLCLARQRQLSIPVTLSSSEMLSPPARDRISTAFGGELIDYYGQAERMCLSYQRHPDEAWFHPAYGFVELFPDHEQIVDEHLRRAKIVANQRSHEDSPVGAPYYCYRPTSYHHR
jgi:phenylacetate-CoA ligase